MIKNIMICAGVLASGACQIQAAKKTEKPNIIFILCDDMGYGNISIHLILTVWLRKECVLRRPMPVAL